MIMIGADGGGTGTTLAAFRNGIRIAEAEAGPLNYRFIPPEEAAGHLTEGLDRLGIASEQIGALGIADPSLNDTADGDDPAAAKFYSLLHRTLPFPVYSRSDAYIVSDKIPRLPIADVT